MRPVFIPAAPGCAKRRFPGFSGIQRPERAEKGYFRRPSYVKDAASLDSLAGRRQRFILNLLKDDQPQAKENRSLSRRPFLLHYFPVLNYPICGGV